MLNHVQDRETHPKQQRGIYSLSIESRRLFIRDRKTNIALLVDTGLDMSDSCRKLPKTKFFTSNSSYSNFYKNKWFKNTSLDFH
ncbi:hypothetical protein CEXT_659081 [Caerostris extrusa]|uniref:Uncharacterized protein n=1 Tax=Caerostris extrusa TaxID=172846 RepID=A0AAV4QP12_CAEEX|nr:hypothetical protein CEXT_659081 [Caerostris extrusa]